jgi:hypothetical protein
MIELAQQEHGKNSFKLLQSYSVLVEMLLDLPDQHKTIRAVRKAITLGNKVAGPDNETTKAFQAKLPDLKRQIQKGHKCTQVPCAHRCAFCWIIPDTDLEKCSRCNITQYCGTECQRADWSEHKASVCRKE